MLSQRNWTTNVTTLSGQGNCYHVFYHDNSYNGLSLNSTAVLDGFTITAGNANAGVSPHNFGGGMYDNSCSPTVTNCTFSGNSAVVDGGGMFNWSNPSPTLTNCFPLIRRRDVQYADASPTVTNCAFTGNSAANAGGGMVNYSGPSPTVTNCLFTGNSAGEGGAMFNFSYASPAVTNCSFSGNSATGYGGGMYNETNSSPSVTNCVLWGDSAATDAEVYTDSTSTPTFGYCDIAGCGGSGGGWKSSIGKDGGSNIAADPKFVIAPGCNFHLSADYGVH